MTPLETCRVTSSSSEPACRTLRDVDAPTQDNVLVGVTTERAAKLAGISVTKLATWERIGLILPAVSRQLGGRRVRVFGLNDLVELRVARQLEDRGVGIRTVRRLVEAHRNHTLPHPLRQLRWATADGQVYVGYEDGNWVGGRHPMQGVLQDTIDLEEIRAGLLSSIGRRDEKMLGQVEQRSRTMGHKAVFAGTRTPVEAVLTYLRRGLPVETVLEAFPHLTREDVAAAELLASA